MVKIPAIIIENVNIFTIYEKLFKNVITILPTTYQNKTKSLEKRESAWFFYKKLQVISTIYNIF